jgi:enamine deaminase RidA (YjgF/YER057c/UK114 family)
MTPKGTAGSPTPHEVITAAELAAPVGFAHAVVARPGRTVYLGGQTAQGPDGTIVGDTITAQFDVAAGNVVAALRAAGARPDHLVSMIIYVTDVAAYRAALPALGAVWRVHFGRHYPAVALLGVAALFDDHAIVELVGTAMIPD